MLDWTELKNLYIDTIVELPANKWWPAGPYRIIGFTGDENGLMAHMVQQAVCRPCVAPSAAREHEVRIVHHSHCLRPEHQK